MLSLLLLSQESYCQKKQISIYFDYTTTSAFASTKTERLYFIIDTTKLIMHNKYEYFGFIFSKDSTDYSGFIRYSKKKKCFYFLSQHYTDLDTNFDSSCYKPQQVFHLKQHRSKGLCEIGELGSYFHLKTRVSKGVIIISVFYDYKSFDLEKIEKIYFTNKLEPFKVQLHNPFTGRIIALGKLYERKN